MHLFRHDKYMFDIGTRRDVDALADLIIQP